MKYIVAAIFETGELVKNNFGIYALYVFFSMLPLLASQSWMPPILAFVLSLFSLGWFALRFEYLFQASRNKSFDLENFYKRLFNWVQRLLPIVIAMAFVIVLPVVLLGLFYGRWFAASYLNEGLGMTTREVWHNLLPALFNFSLWEEFFTQNLAVNFLYRLFQVSTILGWLIAKLVVILLVVETYKSWEAVTRAFYYLNEQLPLMFAYVVFQIGINIIMILGAWLLSGTISLINPFLSTILLVFLISFLRMNLDTFVLFYYLKASKRGFVQRNLVRWWNTKGRSNL